MATYLRTDLRDQVMQDLAILDPNEAPSAPDSVMVLARIQQTLEMLADQGLIPFDLDSDAIPASYMAPIAQVVAPGLCLAFGRVDKLSAYAALAEKGMKDLRKLKAQPYYGAVAQATYY